MARRSKKSNDSVKTTEAVIADKFGARRLRALTIALPAALIINLLLTYKLWLTNRYYPLSPVFDWLPGLDTPTDYILFIGTLGIAALIPFLRLYRPASLSLIVFLLFNCLFDQSRMQPWLYNYLLLFAALAFLSGTDNAKDKESAVLNACRLLIACIYIWGGLHKLNASFMQEVMPVLVQPVADRLAIDPRIFASGCGFFVALMETGLGLGLLITRLRQAAIIVAVILHIAILALIGPFLFNINSSVWSWNAAMIAFVIILFWRTEGLGVATIFASRRQPVFIIIVVLAGVMPLFNLFNMWDYYLSWSLYSGKTCRAMIYVSDNVKAGLPDDMRRYIWQQRDDNFINVFNWSMAELNVPPYPERRIHINIARQLCARAQKPTDIYLLLFEKQSLFIKEDKRTDFDCASLP